MKIKKDKNSLLVKNKKKFVLLNIPVEMYTCNLLVFIGPKEEFKNWVKKRYNWIPNLDEPDDKKVATGGRYYEPFEEAPFLIYLEDFGWYIDEQVALTHELLHFVIYLLHDRGFTLNQGSQEAYTYLLTDVQRKVWNKLKDYNNGTTRRQGSRKKTKIKRRKS